MNLALFFTHGLNIDETSHGTHITKCHLVFYLTFRVGFVLTRSSRHSVIGETRGEFGLKNPINRK